MFLQLLNSTKSQCLWTALRYTGLLCLLEERVWSRSYCHIASRLPDCQIASRLPDSCQILGGFNSTLTCSLLTSCSDGEGEFSLSGGCVGQGGNPSNFRFTSESVTSAAITSCQFSLDFIHKTMALNKSFQFRGGVRSIWWFFEIKILSYVFKVVTVVFDALFKKLDGRVDLVQAILHRKHITSYQPQLIYKQKLT